MWAGHLDQEEEQHWPLVSGSGRVAGMMTELGPPPQLSPTWRVDTIR